MIPQTAVLFSGLLAVLASAGVLDGRRESETRVVLAVLAMAWWGVYAFGMFDIAVPAGDGTFESFTLLSHTIVGTVSGAIMLLFAVDNMREML